MIPLSIVKILLTLVAEDVAAAEYSVIDETYISGDGCKVFHPDEYWECVFGFLAVLAPVYATGLLVGLWALGPPIMVVALLGITMGIISLAMLHAVACREDATYCD